MMRTLGSAVAAVLAASCVTPAAQPAAKKPAAEAPCGLPAPAAADGCGAADSTIATVDGAPIRASELPQAVRALSASADADVAAGKRKGLRLLVDDRLLELEAARRQVSFRDLWEAEVLRKTPATTESDLRALFAEMLKESKDANFEERRASLETQVQAQNREKREQELTHSLEERFPVELKASPSAEGPPDEVLATVGGTKITRADADWRLQAAGHVARINIFFKQYVAARSLANERVLAAEAARRGVTPESLKSEAKAIRKAHEIEVVLPEPVAPAVHPDLAGAPERGGGSAAVTLVEFGDFQCPPCGRMWKIVEEALKPYGPKVRYVFLHSPLPFHEHAQKAAEAARAAQEQGRFFEYADLLFANQGALEVASLKQYAATAGLDAARFASDLDSGRYAADVLLQRRSAERAGAIGTPIFILDGMVLPGSAYSPEGLRAALDAALARR